MSATKEHNHDRFDKLTDQPLEAGQRGKQHPIGWLNMPGYKPETWNPIIGCTKVSPGCDNCYAERMANRLTGIQATKDNYSPVITDSKWNGTTNVCLNQWNWPLVWKAPRMVFVCSMGDLFHESVSFETIEKIYDVMHSNDQHIFIVLTKRPENVIPLMKRVGWGLPFPPNVWIGVTAENQEQANKRIPILLQIPAAKRFVSIEPMLGPVDLTNISSITDWPNVIGYQFKTGEKFEGSKLDWVICGGESGPKARPMHSDWVRSVRDQCQVDDVPFFFKQWGEWLPFDGSELIHMKVIDKHYATREFTFRDGSKLISKAKCEVLSNTETFKVGRKAAGNLLYGEQHHNWPASTGSAAKINI